LAFLLAMADGKAVSMDFTPPQPIAVDEKVKDESKR
jgi:hypothetical protein